MAAAFGGGGGGLEDIPVLLLNQDGGQFSTFVVEAFQSDDLADLLEPALVSDEAAARAAIDADEAAALIIIPPGFSDAILPPGLESGDLSALRDPQVSEVEIYASPARPISAAVLRSITDSILNQFITGLTAGKLSVFLLVENGLLTPDQAEGQGALLGLQASQTAVDRQLVTLTTTAGEKAAASFDWLSYMTPSMALVYLMFTMSSAARSLLAERDSGTLPRLYVSPTSRTAVLGGKMLGTFLIGLTQMSVLILAGRLLYGLKWGDPLGVILATVGVTAAATGWGMLVAALSKRPGQAFAFGQALTLTFAALAGNFVPRFLYPQWLQTAGFISPNAWGLEAYTALISGQSLAQVAPYLLGMAVMAALTFTAAALIFRRQYV